MQTFRQTAVVQFDLPSSAGVESLPLTCERNYGVTLTIDGLKYPALSFRSPVNDEIWREFIRQLRDCNVNRDTATGYRGAEFIRGLGRKLYDSLTSLSPKLHEFLDQVGVPRRLVIQTVRPELHVLPWAALYGAAGSLLASGDLSIVQNWENFSDTPASASGSLNLVAVLGSDTNKATAAALKCLPPEITRDAAGPPEILHLEEHGNAVMGSLGDVSANVIARKFASAKIGLLWSCYSSAANSWGESPALSLNRLGAVLVLSFQAELHNLDARSISGAFYADVFGAAASCDPESALVRIRAAKFEQEYEYANWASMTVYLRSPLDLSGLPLNGPRVPAAGWSSADPGAEADTWSRIESAVSHLLPGSISGLSLPAASGALKGPFPLGPFAAWRGTVIRLDGSADPLSDSTTRELNLVPPRRKWKTVPDKMVWFFEAIANYGAPLIVWNGAAEWHDEFLKAIQAPSTLTFVLLYAPQNTGGVLDLLDRNLLDQAKAAAESFPATCTDDELAAAYFAFARSEMPERAREYIARLQSEPERLLLSANFVSRVGRLPDDPDRALTLLEQQNFQEDSYRSAISSLSEMLRDAGRARHELGYLLQEQGRTGAAEIFYREALADLDAWTGGDQRWHDALAATLRDWAELLADQPERLGEASGLLRRALAIHAFYGRPLQVAYCRITLARIALTAGKHDTANDELMDAANLFEQYANWRGWNAAVQLLLDVFCAKGETHRMLSVARFSLKKITQSNLSLPQRDRIRKELLGRLAEAHWIAGRLGSARKALKAADAAGPALTRKTGASVRLQRLRRFLELPAAE